MAYRAAARSSGMKSLQQTAFTWSCWFSPHYSVKRRFRHHRFKTRYFRYGPLSDISAASSSPSSVPTVISASAICCTEGRWRRMSSRAWR